MLNRSNLQSADYGRVCEMRFVQLVTFGSTAMLQFGHKGIWIINYNYRKPTPLPPGEQKISLILPLLERYKSRAR